tara:strand:+ start:1863 stop:2735 length:873 start_codon:yes stop_codon:yes gene_type:complete
MNTKYENFFSESLSHLARVIGANSSPQLASAMDGFSRSLMEHVDDIEREIIVEKLKGEDDGTRMYELIQRNLPKGQLKISPFDLTAFKDDVVPASEYYLDHWKSIAMSGAWPKSHLMVKQLQVAITKKLENHDGDCITIHSRTYLDPSFPEVSLDVGFEISPNTDVWLNRKYNFRPLFTHKAPWFLEPVTHDILDVIPLEVLDDALNVLLVKNLELPYIEGLDKPLHETRLSLLREDGWGFDIEWLDNEAYKIPVENNYRRRDTMTKVNAFDALYRRIYWMNVNGEGDGN